MDESKLELALRNSWSKETSSEPELWNTNNPSYGQCAVTALVINDYLGGEIIWSQVMLPNGEKISHYFNLVNKRKIDFTKEQFPAETVIPEGVPRTKEFETTREYILSYPETKKRYEILKMRVLTNLEN